MSRVFVSWIVILLLLLLGLPSRVDAQDATETLFWENVVCEKEGEVRAYLRVYPTGAYVDEARACLEQSLGLDRVARILVQRGLASLDYAAGAADGLFGPATRAAVRQWQTGKGFAATGYLTRAQAEALMAAGRDAQAAAARRRAREEATPRELRNSLGMEFVLIEPGTFQMGSRSGEAGRHDDEVRHQVTLSQAYYLGKYEVTQGQWAAVMGDNPSRFSNCGRTCPVEHVSWDDVQEFIRELNRREGANVYRLPTEAEWEYAARAGTQTAYHFGTAANRLGQYGWYQDNSGDQTHPVGGKRPNGWGLYDMLGNVWEWVADWYGAYPRGAVTDPRGPSTGASGCFAAGVGAAPPAIAALRLAVWDSPGDSPPLASASAWRELRNPVRCYPFTLCGGGPSRVLSRRAHSGRRGWSVGSRGEAPGRSGFVPDSFPARMRRYNEQNAPSLSRCLLSQPSL